MAYPDERHVVRSREALMRCTGCSCVFTVRLEWPQGQLVVAPEECPGCGAGASAMQEVET